MGAAAFNPSLRSLTPCSQISIWRLFGRDIFQTINKKKKTFVTLNWICWLFSDRCASLFQPLFLIRTFVSSDRIKK